MHPLFYNKLILSLFYTLRINKKKENMNMKADKKTKKEQ